MLPKILKLRGDFRIERVFKKGRRLSGTLFTMRFFSNQRGSFAAVIVPTSFKLPAVARNRIRRRVYAGLEKNWPFTNGKKYDIVLTVRDPSVGKIPFPKIAAQIISFLKKLP